jgi:Rieske Fe-S protein
LEKNRRQFLLGGWKLLGALLVGAGGYTTYEALRPIARTAAGGKLDLGEPAFFEEGTATYFPEGRLYVVNAKGDLFALSQTCPHLGCKVPFCATSGRFECPCHGSIFDIAGEYIAGPSPRGMDRFRLTVGRKRVVADTEALSLGPDRGAEKYLEPPNGPSCVSDD